MSGAIKIWAITIVGFVVGLLILGFNKRLVIEDDIFESVRMTQISALEENILLGELFVNGKVEIETDSTINSWMDLFKTNSNIKTPVKVEIIDIYESPPAIAVRVQTGEELLHDGRVEIDYINLILIEEGVKK